MSESRIAQAAVVGGGVIGGGWAARLVLSGIDVAFFDPSPAVRESMAATLARARRASERLFDCALPREGALRFCEDSRAAVADADWIFESAPEDIEAKRAVYRQIEEAARADAIVSSSTSGLLPSLLAGRDEKPGAVFGRASVQSGVFAAAGRVGRRPANRARNRRPRARFFGVDRYGAARRAQRNRRVCRRPPARGDVARIAVAG